MNELTVDTSYWVLYQSKDREVVELLHAFYKDEEAIMTLDKDKKILYEYRKQGLLNKGYADNEYSAAAIISYLHSHQRIRDTYSSKSSKLDKALKIHKGQFIYGMDRVFLSVAFQTNSRKIATKNIKHFCKCKWVNSSFKIVK